MKWSCNNDDDDIDEWLCDVRTAARRGLILIYIQALVTALGLAFGLL